MKKIKLYLIIIIKYIVTFISWALLLLPVIYTFHGLITKRFIIFDYKYVAGYKIYLFIFIIFSIWLIFLILSNIIVAKFRNYDDQNKKQIINQKKLNSTLINDNVLVELKKELNDKKYIEISKDYYLNKKEGS